jgi:hypothetical protein
MSTAADASVLRRVVRLAFKCRLNDESVADGTANGVSLSEALEHAELRAFRRGEVTVAQVHLSNEIDKAHQVGRVRQRRRFRSLPDELLKLLDQVRVGLGFASLDIVFVEGTLGDRIWRTVVPGRVVVMFEKYRNNDAGADVGAAPRSAAALERLANLEFGMLHCVRRSPCERVLG